MLVRKSKLLRFKFIGLMYLTMVTFFVMSIPEDWIGSVRGVRFSSKNWIQPTCRPRIANSTKRCRPFPKNWNKKPSRKEWTWPNRFRVSPTNPIPNAYSSERAWEIAFMMPSLNSKGFMTNYRHPTPAKPCLLDCSKTKLETWSRKNACSNLGS